MALGTLMYGEGSYDDVGGGRYISSTLQLGDPRDEIKISGGSLLSKAKPPVTSASVTRLVELPVSSNPADPEATLTNRRLNITVNVQAQSGITNAQIDTELDNLVTLLTPQLITRIMQGAS